MSPSEVFVYCPGGPLSLGVARALQGLVCSSPPQWPRINAAFAPLNLPVPMGTAATLETRADTIGQNAGVALLRSVLDRRTDGRPFRFNLIGHSFGCRVLCAALQAVTEESALLERLADCAFNVVLLQAALDCDALEPGQSFGQVQRGIPRLRMLVTTSAAEPAEAMGSKGPTGNLAIDIDQSFDVTHAIVPTFTGRLGVANLTLLHESPRVGSGDEGRGGRRCDIHCSQIYDLLARFFGQ